MIEIGSKVRVIESFYETVPVGTEGIVEAEGHAGLFDVSIGERGLWFFTAREIEKVED